MRFTSFLSVLADIRKKLLPELKKYLPNIIRQKKTGGRSQTSIFIEPSILPNLRRKIGFRYKLSVKVYVSPRKPEINRPNKEGSWIFISDCKHQGPLASKDICNN